MRRYEQFCPLARALDLIGDRWTLLIVRELAIGPGRYSDIRDGLPGIATNLLAERLRSLEGAGIIAREDAPPPVATTLYRLTPYGEDLRPIIAALARWGAPQMQRGVHGDAFRARWLVPAVVAVFQGVDVRDLAPLRARFIVDGEPVDVVVRESGVTAEVHSATAADVTMTLGPEAAFQVLTGQLTPRQARQRRLATIDGPAPALGTLASLAQRAQYDQPSALTR